MKYIEEVVSHHPAVTRRKIAAHNLKYQVDKSVTRGKGILPPLKVVTMLWCQSRR